LSSIQRARSVADEEIKIEEEDRIRIVVKSKSADDYVGWPNKPLTSQEIATAVILNTKILNALAN